MRVVLVLLVPLLLLIAGCSEPPQKEIDRAQGAIDAARAAGAELYAVEPFSAATTALKQAHDAVAQRDYRLALTRALDASDRAQEAARGAADGKARARSEAETAINGATGATRRLNAQINAYRARLPRAELDAAVRLQRQTEGALQKARASLNTGDYLQARKTVNDSEARIAAQIESINAAVAARPAKPPRRRR
jgi:hypothetical protein